MIEISGPVFIYSAVFVMAVSLLLFGWVVLARIIPKLKAHVAIEKSILL